MFKALTFLLCLFASVNAHFRLLYPGPRGAFVAQNELQFCGNNPEVTTNRTTFPLSKGFIKVSTSHSDWSLGILASTAANPHTWEDFSANGNQTFAKPFAKAAPGGGTFCIPVDIEGAGISGVKEGSNVTIQVVFSGGDGNLYQCADLTLSANATAPADQTCTNATASTTASSPSSTSTTKSAAEGLSHSASAAVALALGLVGAAALL